VYTKHRQALYDLGLFHLIETAREESGNNYVTAVSLDALTVTAADDDDD
jgi:hypothetical protein